MININKIIKCFIFGLILFCPIKNIYSYSDIKSAEIKKSDGKIIYLYDNAFLVTLNSVVSAKEKKFSTEGEIKCNFVIRYDDLDMLDQMKKYCEKTDVVPDEWHKSFADGFLK